METYKMICQAPLEYQLPIGRSGKLSTAFKNLLLGSGKGLLAKSPSKRLGAGVAGTEAVKKSGWFSGSDWNALATMNSERWKPPIVPKVKADDDTTNFETISEDKSPAANSRWDAEGFQWI